MNLDNDLLTYINNYLNHQLSETERNAFEEQIASDTALQQEVKRQKIIREAVLRTEYKALFKQIHDEQEHTSQKFGGPRQANRPIRVSLAGWYYWAMAASVVLLMGLGWLFFRQAHKIDKLYAGNYSVHPKQPRAQLDPEVMGSSRQPHVQADSADLASAIQWLAINNSEKAIPILRRLSSQSGNHWNRVADWYLALSYLKQNERDAARQKLQSIVNERGHPYQDEATRLLRKLD